MIPSTSHPEFRASIVAAEMTEFIPGAGPPPHKIPSLTPPHRPSNDAIPTAGLLWVTDLRLELILVQLVPPAAP